MHRLSAVIGLLVILLGGCGSRGSQGSQGFVELDSYGMDDFKPFRKMLIEDEFTDHPELYERTVYHLQLEIGEPVTEIAARARIRFTNREQETIEQIPFFLYPNLTPGGLEVHTLSVDGVAVDPELRDRGSRLLAHLPAALEPGQSVEFVIEYDLFLPVTDEGEYGGFGYVGGVLSLAYCYPMIPAFAGWNHPLPVPYGDFIFNEVSFYLVQVSMPHELILAAPGIELGARQADGRREVIYAMGPSRDLYLALSEEFVIETERIGQT